MADAVSMDKIVSSASAAASCSRPPRSTAGSARRTTTATTACSSRTTSSSAGCRRWCRSATTSSRSTRRSSCTREVWEASGHVGGFTDPLVDCRFCKQRFRPTTSTSPNAASARASTRARPTTATSPRPASSTSCSRRGWGARGDRRAGLPPPGDGAGHLHQLQERRPDRPPQAAVRHRAGRQVVPQRDHARQLHLPHARVRADGDGVLRAAHGRRGVVRLLGAGALRLAPALRDPRSHLRIRPHEADELSHYSSGTSDIEYLFPIGWSELEGVANRGDFDLTAHTQSSGTKLEWVEQATAPATSRT